MRTRNLTDGVTTDGVSEFIYAPDDVFPALFADSETSYLDAILKMLQVLGSSEAVLLPDHPMKTDYSEKLREVLKSEQKLATYGETSWPDPQGVESWLQTNWPRLMEAIAANRDLKEAIVSFLRREYHLAFENVVPGYDPRHYYPSSTLLRVPQPLRNWLIDSVADLTNGASLSRDDAGAWIDAAMTTHYRNFRWNWEAVGFEYTPSFTRTAAAVVMPVDFGTEAALLPVRRCIAAEMIAGVKRREDLLRVAIDWTRSEKGREVLEGYDHLRAVFAQADETERQKHRQEMDRILNSQISGKLDAAFGVFGVVGNVMTGKAPDESISLSTPPSLRWLWNVRHPAALADIAHKVRELAGRS